MEPRYQHDCSRCKFLGQYQDYDVYICPQVGIPTLLGRYGDRVEEYSCHPIGSNRFDLPVQGWHFYGIAEALKQGYVELVHGDRINYRIDGIHLSETRKLQGW